MTYPTQTDRLKGEVGKKKKTPAQTFGPVFTLNGQAGRGGSWTARLPHTRCKSCAEFAECTKQRTYFLNVAMLMEVLYGFATRLLAGIASYST